ncbi:hypothetical protein FACS1894199_13440 [Bacteroidia bacterium]|nr:hypothetical protein FACS1894199_13440 [Bacteroidia bacterium]
MMNKKALFLLIIFFNCFCGGFSTIHAQEKKTVTVKGMVTDAVTGEAIPLANIGVLGTHLGVAAGMDGEFELELAAWLSDHTLRTSVVGYATFEIKVKDAVQHELLKIKLKPVTFKINEVQVKAKSLVYIKMLKQAVKNIAQNYPNKPYNYSGYFEYKTTRNDLLERSKEAIVTIYDKRGYERSNVEKAFRDLNCTFSEVRRDKTPRTIYDKLMNFDDIITADVVRHTRNVLDTLNLNYIELTNHGWNLLDGDSVQVIGYVAATPSISISGDAGSTKWSGKIYINLADFAIVKNEMIIASSNYTVLGRNLMAPQDKIQKENVRMLITTTYKKSQSTYILNSVHITTNYKEGGDQVKSQMNYVTTGVNTDTPRAIDGRQYFEEIQENTAFWQGYSVEGIE